MGHRYEGKLAEWGEPIMLYVADEAGPKGRAKWQEGIFLSKAATNDTFICGIGEQIRLTRAIKRIQPDWSKGLKLFADFKVPSWRVEGVIGSRLLASRKPRQQPALESVGWDAATLKVKDADDKAGGDKADGAKDSVNMDDKMLQSLLELDQLDGSPEQAGIEDECAVDPVSEDSVTPSSSCSRQSAAGAAIPASDTGFSGNGVSRNMHEMTGDVDEQHRHLRRRREPSRLSIPEFVQCKPQTEMSGLLKMISLSECIINRGRHCTLHGKRKICLFLPTC